MPIFSVSTTRDHIAPWRSVFKITRLAQADVTFVLASGGHNAGIVSEPEDPGHATQGREFRIGDVVRDGVHVDAEAWAARATRHDGSWWPAWQRWLEAWSGDRVAPPPMGSPANGHHPLAEAPGAYVLDR